MKGLVRTTIAASIVAGLLSLGAVPALATHVTCGETITRDTKLDNDLSDCPPEFGTTPAIVIGADGVTLDLNGHAVGPGGGINTTEIDNEGYDHLTVKDGTVSGAYAIAIRGAADNLVTNVHAGGRGGVVAADAHGLQITKSVIDGGAIGGIVVGGTGDFRIEDNVVSEGISISSSDPQAKTVIRGNVVTHNTYCGICAGVGVIEHNFVTYSETGIYASGALIRHNVVEHSYRDGIVALGSTAVSHNTANLNLGDGIRASDSVTVSHNTANYNGSVPQPETLGLGINADPTVIDGGGNRAKGNANPLQCLNVFCK
jgi:hypothetical protein